MVHYYLVSGSSASAGEHISWVAILISSSQRLEGGHYLSGVFLRHVSFLRKYDFIWITAVRLIGFTPEHHYATGNTIVFESESPIGTCRKSHSQVNTDSA
jgi:hypothetical protein